MKKIILLTIALVWAVFGIAQTCSFTYSPNPVCEEGVTLSVTNPQAGVNYGWDVNNDGTIDFSGTNLLYNFGNTGTYPVNLYADGVWCAASNVSVFPIPDPTIGIAPGTGVLTGTEIRTCTSTPTTTLELTNMSTTILNNASYVINWGDGSSDTYTNVTFNNAGVNASHTYTAYGYYTITVEVTSNDGCVASSTYNYYNGNNPSIGLATPGNTVSLCSPAPVTFPITDYVNNPTGTQYIIYVNGQQVATYDQSTIPSSFTYLFEESSCGEVTSTGNYINAFDVQISASNPCGSSSATVEPIEISLPPEPGMLVQPPATICTGNIWTFVDTTEASEIISGNPSTCSDILATWSISPGAPFVDWIITNGNLNGSDSISVQILTAGTYTVEMSINSQACGVFTVSETITAIDPPDLSFDSNMDGPDNCASFVGSFTNTATGGSATYSWSISPSSGWTYVNGTNSNSTDIDVQFDEVGAYLVTLLGTNACGTFEVSEEVEVAGPPELSLNSIPDFCNSATIFFDDNFYDYIANYSDVNSFTWSFPGGTPSSSTDSIPGNVVYDTPGTYTVTLEIENACGIDVQDVSFTIETPPTLSISGPDTLCLTDSSVQLTGSIAGGNWSGDGVSGSGVFDPGLAGVGTHEIVYEATVSLCTVYDTLSIEVLPLPVLNISAADTEACVNDSAIDLFATPSGGTWTSSGGGVIINDQFIPSNSGAGSYTLTYSYSDAYNCANTASLAIEIFGLPSLTVPDATYCNSAAIENLPVALPTGGTWSGPGVVDGNSGLFSAVAAGGVGTYILTYTYTDGNSCTSTSDMTVTVEPQPSISLDPDMSVCEDHGLIDIAAVVNPSGGTWIYGGPGLTGTLFDPAAAGPGTYTFTYSYGIGNCNVQEDFQITVNPLPNLNISAESLVCEEVTCVNLIAAPLGGYWTSDNGGVILGNCFDPSTSGIGNYTITYHYTDGNGCSNTATLDIEVYGIPTLIVPDTFYCLVNEAYNLPIANFPGGTWTGPGVTDPTGLFNPITAGGVGTYTLNYAYADALGCANDIGITVTVNPIPEPNMGADFALCEDAPAVDLAGSTTPSGGSYVGVSMNGSIFDPAVAGVGTHEIIYIYGTGSCYATDTLFITVDPLPVIDLSANLDGICVSETSLLLQATPTGGTWTGNNGAVISGSTFDPNASGIGTYTLTYTYTDGNGCSQTANWNLEVYDLPVVSSSDIAYCDLPGEVNLPFASPIGGTWSGPGVTDAVGLFDPALVAGVGTYTLTYTFSDGFGCSNNTTITVTIVAPLIVDAGPDIGICLSAAAVDLSAQASPSGGSWTGPGISGSTFDPSITGVGTFELVYSVGSDNCQVWDTLLVDVYALPVVDVSGNTPDACVAQDSIILTASPIGGVWSSSNGGQVIGNTFYPSLSGSGNYTLTYTYTDGNGCSNSDQFDLEIYDLPTIIVSDATYCTQGDPITLPAASPAGGTWSGPGIIDANAGIFDPLMPVGTYTLTYSYMDANGCSNSAEAIITLIEPTVISAGPDLSFCLSEDAVNLELQASPTGGTWSGPGITGTMFSPQNAGVGIHEVVYSFGSDNCTVWDTLYVEIFELPNIDISNNTAETCVSTDSIYLSASLTGGLWSSPDGGQLNGDIFLPSTSGAGVFTLVYSYTNANNCYAEDQYLFTVHALPVLSSNDTTYCFTPGVVNLPFATPVGGSWTGPGVVDPAGLFEPSAVGSAGTYAVYYSYVDANSCVSSLQIEVSIEDLEVVDAGPDQILCIDQGLHQLTGFTPVTGGTWSGPGIVDAANGVFDPSISGAGIFTLQFDYGNLNCAQSDEVTIEVIDLVSIVEAGPDFEICAYDEEIFLDGHTPLGGKWSGPGITDIDEGRFNPTLAGVGTHTISYTYVDAYSQCEVTTDRIIDVRPVPVTDFFADQVDCVNVPVTFNNTSNDLFQSDWTVVNHAEVSVTDLTYVFDNPGNYEVMLLSTNVYSCQDSLTQSILIAEAPDPDFEMDLDSGCGPLTVAFNNTSIGYAMSYDWDFGNGTYSVDSIPSPVTFDLGADIVTYPIQLTVSNLCGDRVLTDTVTVNPSPQVNFGPVTNIDCSPMEVTFANQTVGLPQYYLWDLGNGNFTNDSIPENQLYYAADTITNYTISLIAVNACGADTMEQVITVNPPSVNAFVNIPALAGCAPFTPELNNVSTVGVDYLWDFGDGNTSIDPNPDHTYTEAGEYTITLSVSNNCNFDSVTQVIQVTPQPVIDFNVDEISCVNNTIQFENLSTDAQGYLWDFGNNNTSNLVNPSFTFPEVGTVTVSLYGEDASTGCSALESKDIEIMPLPVAEFIPSDTSNCTPLVVDFENTNNSNLFYTWDFGNGSGSVSANPSYTFTEPGVHTVTLLAEDLYGCISEPFAFDLFVHPQPTADFSIPALDFCTDEVIQLENLSTGYQALQWTLDGVPLSTLPNPSIQFGAGGDHEVQLTVTNLYNCVDIIDRTIEVYQRPVADAAFDITGGCAPLEVPLENLSSNTTKVIWNVGGTTLPQHADDTYVFQDAGLYTVGMIAINTFESCADTLDFQDIIEVLPVPTADFNITDLGNGIMQFENLSEGYTQLNWDFGDGVQSNEVHPQHEFIGNNSWEVRLAVSNEYNCEAVAMELLEYDFMYGFYVPNAFSPEFGEGDVQFFKPAGLGIKDYVIEVFAPWGQQLWQSSELDGEQPAAAWDGIYKGEIMPQGAYAWKVSVEYINGHREVLNGTVTLLR